MPHVDPSKLMILHCVDIVDGFGERKGQNCDPDGIMVRPAGRLGVVVAGAIIGWFVFVSSFPPAASPPAALKPSTTADIKITTEVTTQNAVPIHTGKIIESPADLTGTGQPERTPVVSPDCAASGPTQDVVLPSHGWGVDFSHLLGGIRKAWLQVSLSTHKIPRPAAPAGQWMRECCVCLAGWDLVWRN